MSSPLETGVGTVRGSTYPPSTPERVLSDAIAIPATDDSLVSR